MCLALITVPCQALELGRASVKSKRGEPLDAYVRIYANSSERIDNSCLSVGDLNDYPQSDHVLIRDVKLSLLASQNTIRISTSKPLDLPAVSMALRVRCGDGPLTVRALNLYLIPPGAPVSSVRLSDVAGTSITVRPGDSVYGLARTIVFPKDEKAVRELALAIALVNPALFPDGRPRPLQIGERLTIPDLRKVKEIVAHSGKSPASLATPATKMAALSSPSVVSDSGDSPSPPAKLPATKARRTTTMQPSFKMATGKLRLKLALSIDLSPSRGMTEAKRVALRRGIRPAAASEPVEKPIAATNGLSQRIEKVRQAQDGIDAQILQLESTVATLHNQILSIGRDTPPPRPTTRSAPTAVLPRDIEDAPQTTAPWWHVKVWRQKLPSLQSPTWLQSPDWWHLPAATVLALLLAAAFVYRRKFRQGRVSGDESARIDSMLERARVAATPLLGSETALPGATGRGQRDVATAPDRQTRDSYEDRPSPQQTAETFERQAISTVIDPSAYMPGGDAPAPAASSSAYPDIIDPGASGDVTQELRQEMDDAIDAARSMFSDVDRFIALGRTQNAISLLEFQIKRDPQDRGAWVKLMAIYSQEGMEDEFESTHAAFSEQFRDA